MNVVLTRLLETLSPGAPVVFDADGTLWRGDVGEDFLRWAIHQRFIDAKYETYEALLSQSHARAYGWAVEVMAGLREDEVLEHTRRFFKERFSGRIFPFVRPLLAKLSAHPVWICSASPWWVVVPGAEALGVPLSQVIGVRCDVVDGRLTGTVHQPVPCGEGKVTWLQRASLTPGLAVGNGDLDLDMLTFAKRPLVVTPADSSNGLVAHARRNDWPILIA